MPAVLLPGRRPRLLLHLWLASLVLLAASCRSSQTAYRFRPGATTVASRAVPADSSVTPSQATASLPVTALHQATIRPPRRAPVASRPLQRQMRQAIAQVAAKAPKQSFSGRSSEQAVKHVAKPRRAAEAGLGTTVLGVLGLVVLPIALLGLLIWGGPVWAILGGLAALAVLIAYLDPFA
ncbi:hypothetical protein DNI29_00480 [Hymenobacter sediminis]|uniref:hypothetical protein n=1 Tax=Hymenobacter sediminis TaxID=2218621 RepID=UPI000F508338|nr:hypothetical protein [Hymenobacter sediminis]RPD49315.1 hypothetical protein DNI29_00480 [Hymenobacter sediminis]